MPSDYVTHRDADACRHRSVIGTMNAQHLANVCRYGLYEHTQYSVGMRGQTTQRSEFGRNTYDARLSFISGKWTFNAGVSTRSGCITGFHPRYQRSNESLIMRRPLFRSGTAGRFWIMAGLKGWSFSQRTPAHRNHLNSLYWMIAIQSHQISFLATTTVFRRTLLADATHFSSAFASPGLPYQCRRLSHSSRRIWSIQCVDSVCPNESIDITAILRLVFS